MEIKLTENAWEDLEYWKGLKNLKILNRIDQLIASIENNPINGIGKPEALKHNYSGYLSRRITKEHRIIYKIQSDTIIIYSLRFHYPK